MKTNVILKSKDRNLFGLIVRQQTKTMFLCVTDLQKAYNEARWQYGWSDRRIERVTVTNDFKERVYHLLFELKIISVSLDMFLESILCLSITKVLKDLNLWVTHGRGEDRSVFCHPLIWFTLCTELHASMFLPATKFIEGTGSYFCDSDLKRISNDNKIREIVKKGKRKMIVYFVQSADNKTIKIGTTSDIEARLAALRCSHGNVKYITSINGGFREEKKVHEFFKQSRIDNSEWFNLGKKSKAEIDSIMEEFKAQ